MSRRRYCIHCGREVVVRCWEEGLIHVTGKYVCGGDAKEVTVAE